MSIGFKGAAHDSPSYYNGTSIGRNPRAYFRDGEYLLGDKGFAISENLITPFKENQLGELRFAKTEFNNSLTRCRIVVEHVFGIIKSRFMILRSITSRKFSKQKLLIHAGIILHNVCLSYADDEYYDPSELLPDDEEDSSSSESDSENVLDVRQNQRDSGQRKRREILMSSFI